MATVGDYCNRAGRPMPAEGVMARAIQGNASNSDALEVAERSGILAAIGQNIAKAADVAR